MEMHVAQKKCLNSSSFGDESINLRKQKNNSWALENVSPAWNMATCWYLNMKFEGSILPYKNTCWTIVQYPYIPLKLYNLWIFLDVVHAEWIRSCFHHCCLVLDLSWITISTSSWTPTSERLKRVGHDTSRDQRWFGTGWLPSWEPPFFWFFVLKRGTLREDPQSDGKKNDWRKRSILR